MTSTGFGIMMDALIYIRVPMDVAVDNWSVDGATIHSCDDCWRYDGLRCISEVCRINIAPRTLVIRDLRTRWVTQSLHPHSELLCTRRAGCGTDSDIIICISNMYVCCEYVYTSNMLQFTYYRSIPHDDCAHVRCKLALSGRRSGFPVF